MSQFGLWFGGSNGKRSDSGAGNIIDFSHCWESQALGTASSSHKETFVAGMNEPL